MTDKTSTEFRRQFLQAIGTGSLLALSGCLVEDKTTDTNFEDFEMVGGSKSSDPIDWGDLDQPVPEEMTNCTSISGHQRNPNDLAPKEDVAYQTFPANHQLCANCVFFCPTSTTSRLGACARVEGRIGSQHWCALWQPARGLPQHPDPTSFGNDSDA